MSGEFGKNDKKQGERRRLLDYLMNVCYNLSLTHKDEVKKVRRIYSHLVFSLLKKFKKKEEIRNGKVYY